MIEEIKLITLTKINDISDVPVEWIRALANEVIEKRKILSNIENIWVYGNEIKFQDDKWHVFTRSGESTCSANTIEELLIKWGEE